MSAMSNAAGSVVRNAADRLKRDWRNSKAGILVVAGLWLLTTILGRGLCVFRELTGTPCPGCGLTRSVLFILRGRWEEAWRMHPFGYGWCAFFLLFFLTRYVTGRREQLWKAALVILCAGMVLFYIYRIWKGEINAVYPLFFS